MKKPIFFILKILITVALVYWLIIRVDWQGVLEHLANISWVLLTLYVCLQLLGNLFNVKKWQSIARSKNLLFTVKEGFFAFLTGAFLNNFFPSTIGGDTYRSIWLAQKSGAKAAALSTVVFDRFIGLWTTAILAVLASVFLWSYIPGNFPLILTLLVLIGFLLADFFLTVFYYRTRYLRMFIQWIPIHKVRRFLEEVVFFTQAKIWFKSAIWSALFIFVGIILSNYTLFSALGITIPFFPFVATILLVAIVQSIPISIGNIGIKEWVYVVFFGLIGVSVEAAVTVALLSRFIQMFISFIGLPHYLAAKGGEANPIPQNGISERSDLAGR